MLEPIILKKRKPPQPFSVRGLSQAPYLVSSHRRPAPIAGNDSDCNNAVDFLCTSSHGVKILMRSPSDSCARKNASGNDRAGSPPMQVPAIFPFQSFRMTASAHFRSISEAFETHLQVDSKKRLLYRRKIILILLLFNNRLEILQCLRRRV